MSRDSAPDLVAVVGCPRSGTTWLQLMLASHPEVATVNETHLFSKFLGPALEGWDDLDESPRAIGLASVCDRQEFLRHTRAVAQGVLARIARSDGGDAQVVVEKTPEHALWGRELLEVLPGARVLHLVRDPRDVTASLLAANVDWGAGWAPDNAYDAAWTWRDYVEAARGLRKVAERYREIRYEDLLESPREMLAGLLRWSGVDAPDGVVEKAVRETSLSRMQSGRSRAPWNLDDEPDGFVRKGGSGNWRDDLSRHEAHLVEHVCREEMEETGYAPSRSAPFPPLALLPYWIRDRLRWRLC